jgi:DNA processing protein
MTPEEEKIFAILNESGKTGIDELCIKAGIPMSRVSAALLNLEFEGAVRSLPGKQYEPG